MRRVRIDSRPALIALLSACSLLIQAGDAKAQQKPCTVAECAQQAVDAAARAEAAVKALEQKLDALVNIIQGDSGQCIRIREEQLCWLRSGVLEVPASPSQHVRYFTVKFPASFVAPPTITPTVLTKGGGYNFAVMNYEIYASQVIGTVVESMQRQTGVPVDLQIVAAGRWK